jgi:hypothetical protein
MRKSIFIICALFTSMLSAQKFGIKGGLNLSDLTNFEKSFEEEVESEKYKTGKMNPIKAFYIGLVSNWKANSTKEYSSLIYILKKR